MFELLLQVAESLLAHHLDLRCYAFIEHTLTLQSRGRESVFGSLLVFASRWLIYLLVLNDFLVFLLVDVVLHGHFIILNVVTPG